MDVRVSLVFAAEDPMPHPTRCQAGVIQRASTERPRPSGRWLRDVNYSHLFDGRYEVLDHVMLNAEPALRRG